MRRHATACLPLPLALLALLSAACGPGAEDAGEAGKAPVVLAEYWDRPGDATRTLRELIDQEVGGVLYASLTAAPRPALQASDTLPDPEEAVDDARSAQRAFERHRRRRLPYMGGGSGGRCDEIVGRYCLWHDDDGGRDREPPEESESVRRERVRLLERLEDALAAAPRSDWLVGQRVRYLVDAGRPAEALRQATSGCRAALWWCRALQGFVHHDEGRHVRAERAFAAALRVMDAGRRRRWTDLSLLLGGDAEDRWEEGDEAARERMARRLWRMADPLWLVPGNDRRTEHLSRRVAVRMREDAATPFSSYWDPGLGELTLRYGVPWAFGRRPPGAGDLASQPEVVGRHHPRALHWLPSSDALLDPARAEADAWELDDPEPRTEHAPPYADTTGRLDHWLSVFPRGDTTVVVAAFRPALAAPAAEGDRDDGAPAGEALLRLVPVAALDSAEGLTSAASGEALPAPEDRWAGGPRRGLAVSVPSRPHLLSLELLHRRAKVAERSRYGLPLERRLEGLPGLSDLLVLEPADSLPPAADALPSTLEAALPRARPPGAAAPGDRLALYWELYGPRRLLENVEVSLTLAERGGGVIDRLAGALGLRDDRVVALGWRDRVGEAGRVHPRSVRLRLPGELSDGDYRLVLSVTVPGYEEMTAGRELRVEEPE